MKDRLNTKFVDDKSLFIPEEMVQVRVISNVPIHSFSKEKPKEINQIIIHFHGGGYVGNSSEGHQTYTRQWARELNVPIFSVDYRLAP